MSLTLRRYGIDVNWLAGLRIAVNALLVIHRCIIMLVTCYIKVRIVVCMLRLLSDRCYVEGAFEAAEVHYLVAGKRDSARMLAQMYVEWSSTGGTPGAFALRGTIP